MLVFQVMCSGVDASHGLAIVGGSFSNSQPLKGGDKVTSAIVLTSTNVSFPVGADVTQFISNTITVIPSGGPALIMNSSDFSNTRILLTVQRGDN